MPLVHYYFVPTGDEYSFQVRILRRRAMLCDNYSPLGDNYTSTSAEPMFAANFCLTGTEVGCSALSRHWRGSRYLSPLETDSHFGPIGSEVGATAQNLSRWDRISEIITISLRRTRLQRVMPFTQMPASSNFCAVGTEVKMRSRWGRINESPPAPHFQLQKNSIQGFLTAGS